MKKLQGWLVKDHPIHGRLFHIACKRSHLFEFRHKQTIPFEECLKHAKKVLPRWDRMQKFYRDRNQREWKRLTLEQKRAAIKAVELQSNIYDDRQQQLVHEYQLSVEKLYSPSEIRQIQQEDVAKYGKVVRLVDTGQSVPILWMHGRRGFYFETVKEAKEFGRRMLGPEVEFVESKC